MNAEKICTYNELDNYTGSISHSLVDLPRLVNDLKLACLLYDRVVLHANNIMEHPLTLPACEILYPFVKSGKLWTATDYKEKTPIDFMEKRAELFLGDIQKNQNMALRGLPKKRKQQLISIIDRWKAIIPDEFALRRDINLQVKTALANLNNDAFARLEHSRIKIAYRMLDFIERMKANNRFDRESLFARLGSLTGLMRPQHITDIAITIQRSFLIEGAKQHGQYGAKVWFGQFTQKLQKANLINPSDFDKFTFPLIETQFKMIGLDLNWLLSLPIEDLFEIANSTAWKNIRNSILDETLDITHHQEISSYLRKIQSSAKKLEILLTNINISPLILPSAWLLSSQALLGNFSNSVENSTFKAEYTLNLSTHTIYSNSLPTKVVNLTVVELHLISLLASAGEIGLYEEHVKQLDIELEQLERIEYATPTHYFVSKDMIDNRLNKLAKLKSRINNILKQINLSICVKNMNGHWYLGDTTGQSRIVKLERTVWESYENMFPDRYTPKGLSRQLQLVWQCLWEHAPAFVNWQKIAILLDQVDSLDEAHKMKRVSDMINKLGKAIVNENYMVLRDYCGNYRIHLKKDCNISISG